MKKKKLHKIDFDNNPQNEVVFGIASPQNDYRLSWYVNNRLNYKLVKNGNLNIPGKNFSFPVFTFDDDKNGKNIKLITNKSENEFLVPKLKNIDFFLYIAGNFDAQFIEQTKKKLRDIEIVMGVFILPAHVLKKLIKYMAN